MNMLKKSVLVLSILLLTAGCSSGGASAEYREKITIAAAASMEYSLEQDIIPAFAEKYNIAVEGAYDSSGKLQQQIENGLNADVFISAATKQMNALAQEGYIESSEPLLINKVVLIKAKGSKTAVTGFENITDAETIAIGDPDSVPAGQYAKEILTNINLWDSVLPKSSLGTNVTEVLNWTAAGSAEVGIVYATDAAQADVDIIAEAPEGSLAEDVIYPVGILSGTEHKEAAEKFVEYIKSDEAARVFAEYGFTVYR